MNELISSDAVFSSDESHLISVLCRLMIPPGKSRPGADDPDILGSVIQGLASHEAVVKPALQRITPLFTDGMSGANQLEVVSGQKSDQAAFFQIFELLVIQTYYQDPRVLASLGVNSPSPYPQGYDVAETDWSILESVRKREPFFRIVD